MAQHVSKRDSDLFHGFMTEMQNTFKITIPTAVIELINSFCIGFLIYALGDNHHGIFGHKEPKDKRRNAHILEKLQSLAASLNDIYFNKTSIAVRTKNNKIYISGHGKVQKLFIEIDVNKHWCHQINYQFKKPKFEFMDNLSIICTGWEMSSHSVAMTTDGKIYFAGSNYTGAFGNGDFFLHKSILCTEIDNSFVPHNDSIIEIKCGNYHTVFLTRLGNVFCCGENTHGQCGVGDYLHFTKPTHIQFDTRITDISCGWAHNIFIDENKDLHVFGSNAHGALGIGDRTNDDIYKGVRKAMINEYFKDNHIKIMKAECGGEYSVCIDTFGNCYTFGSNYWGYIGNGKWAENDSEDVFIPYKLKVNDEFESVSCGGSHTVGLSKRNRIITWGSNIYCQCGRFATTTRYPYVWSKKQELNVDEDTLVEIAIALKNATIIIIKSLNA